MKSKLMKQSINTKKREVQINEIKVLQKISQ